MNDNQNVNIEENLQEIEDLIRNLIDNVANQPQTSKNPNVINQANQIINETLDQIQIYPNQSQTTPTYEIFRTNRNFIESYSDLAVGVCTTRLDNVPKTITIQPTVPTLPPSYSTVIKQGQPSLNLRRDVRSMEVQHISPFTRRIPPPAYAEINTTWSREFSNASSEQILLGPDPIYIWCNHCGAVVITVTQSQISKFTHLTAAALCLFGCWPCAMLPYCMSSCNNIYHFCPDCNYSFGMYRPW